MFTSLATTAAFTLPALFYPVSFSRDTGSHPVQVHFSETPLVLYRNTSHHVVVHSDICPHQGASFANAGHVSSSHHLVCGYHGFKFCQGRFLGVQAKHAPRHGYGYQMPLWDVMEEDGVVYAKPPAPAAASFPIYQCPEAQDPSFRNVMGCRTIAQDHQVVTENVLDMMHVSYVHQSFGNRASPLPWDVKYEPLGPWAGRSTFLYHPRPGSLASFLGPPFPEVQVENEFHLPSTTVTRVTTRHFVKTVVTRALPQPNGATKLFWEVHRNFGCDSWGLGDQAMAYLMERTLDEDVAILRHVDPQHRDGPLRTKYDITIRKFRQAVDNWVHARTSAF